MSAFLYNLVNGEVKEHRVCPSRVAGMLKSGYKADPKDFIEDAEIVEDEKEEKASKKASKKTK